MNNEAVIGQEFPYNDMEKLAEILVGRRIVRLEKTTPNNLAGYSHGKNAFAYTLDDGTKLYAVDADGGCACSNGCFYITPAESLPENVIAGVSLVEEKVDEWSESAVIRLFVYSEMHAATELFSSAGGDNGYYGWGHHVVVQWPESVS